MSRSAKVPVSLLVKVAVFGVLCCVAAALILRGVDVRGLAEQVFAWIRAAGPWVFFGSMVVLPAIGWPLSFFYLSAGPAFADQMTMPGVVAASLVASAANLALTYWLAHRGIRPLAEWILRRTSFRVPQVSRENELAVSVVVRVTPGPPFFLQGYLLGLAGVRFRTYMVVSWGVQCVFGTGFIVFGRALMEGKSGLAIIGVMVIVAAGAAVQLVRRHYARQNAGAA